MYKKSILDNGLTVATHYMSGRVSVSLGIWIKVGARYESLTNAGISHFLEHLLFKGTKKRNCDEIKQSIEGLGGSLNAFTAKEATCYLAKIPLKHFSSSLDVLTDMVLNATLSECDIKTERKVILEEIRMYKDLPGHFVVDLLSRLLWPNQPLGMNTAGEASSVRSITRKHLLNYRQKFYCLNNIVVVACGSLPHQKVLRAVKKCFSAKPSRAKIKGYFGASCKQTHPQLDLQFKDTEQTHLALGLHGVSRKDPERFALALLHTILGANMSSRLFSKVREEKGLAYEIGSWIKFFADTGAFIVHAGVDNRRVFEAVDVIMKELQRVRVENVQKNELKRAKEYCIGQLMLALEDTSDHMLWLGEGVIGARKFLTPTEVIQRIKKVTASNIRCMAGRIWQNNNLNLALIGPLKDKDRKKIRKRLTF